MHMLVLWRMYVHVSCVVFDGGSYLQGWLSGVEGRFGPYFQELYLWYGEIPRVCDEIC